MGIASCGRVSSARPTFCRASISSKRISIRRRSAATCVSTRPARCMNHSLSPLRARHSRREIGRCGEGLRDVFCGTSRLDFGPILTARSRRGATSLRLAGSWLAVVEGFGGMPDARRRAEFRAAFARMRGGRLHSVWTIAVPDSDRLRHYDGIDVRKWANPSKSPYPANAVCCSVRPSAVSGNESTHNQNLKSKAIPFRPLFCESMKPDRRSEREFHAEGEVGAVLRDTYGWRYSL